MAFCVTCGHENDDRAKFCASCGSIIGNVNSNYQYDISGQIIRCSSCGKDIPSFTPVCPACGCEFRSTSMISSVKELALKIEYIEATREPQPVRSLTGKLYGGDGQVSKTDQQIVNVIRSFPIPNIKEDILEFMILASSNINYKLYGCGYNGNTMASQREVSDAWFAKMEQVYEKSKLMFDGMQTFVQIEAIYQKTKKKLSRKRMEMVLLCSSPIIIIVILSIILSILPEPTIEQQIENRNHHLEYLVDKIEDDIAEGKYTDARNKAYTLTFDEELSDEYSEYWEKKQQEILEQIEKASNGQYDDEQNDVSYHNPIVEGFMDAISDNVDDIQENVDEFNRIMDGE